MSYKHITTAKWEQIKKAAAAVGDLESGTGNKIKKENEVKADLIAEYGREVQKLPQKFKILYIADSYFFSTYYKGVKSIELDPKNQEVEETKKSYIVHNANVPDIRYIVKKSCILAFVW